MTERPDDKAHSKGGRRQPRFMAPSGPVLYSRKVNWASIEDVSGISLSDKARTRIQWELDWYWLRKKHTNFTISELDNKRKFFLKTLERVEKTLADLARVSSEESDDAALEGSQLEVLGRAIQDSLIEQGVPIEEAQRRRLQWHEDFESVWTALPRLREYLETPLLWSRPAESPPETKAWARFVRSVAEVLEAEGHSTSANHDPETPIVTIVRMSGLGGHGTRLSLARRIQMALRQRQPKKSPPSGRD